MIKKYIKVMLKNELLNLASYGFFKKAMSPWKNSVAFFCFHRVLPRERIESDGNPNHEFTVSTEFFDNFLKELKKTHRLCSLDEAIDHLRNGSSEQIAHITFDDGYKDNLDYALPILEKHNAPATIYITTRFAEGDAWVWWIELWDIVLASDSIAYRFDNQDVDLDCHSKQDKVIIFKHLSEKFSSLTIEQQKELLWSLSKSTKRASYFDLCLNWSDIKRLDAHPLITIGSHTHSHPNLSVETDDDAFYEIAHSKLLLEAGLGRKIDHLAYPFGGRGEFGIREIDIAKNIGYVSAVTTICKKWDKDSLFTLPRYFVTESSSPSILQSRISGLCNILGHQLV